jgi:hypothetical protein
MVRGILSAGQLGALPEYKAARACCPQCRADTACSCSSTPSDFHRVVLTTQGYLYTCISSWYLAETFNVNTRGANPVRISAELSTIVTEIFHCFPYSFQKNAGIVPYIISHHFSKSSPDHQPWSCHHLILCFVARFCLSQWPRSLH